MKYSPEALRAVPFSDASTSDIAGLKNRVEKNNGLLEVMVHPWYQRTTYGFTGEYDASKGFKKRRDTHLRRTQSPTAPPTVLFEDIRHASTITTNLVNSGVTTGEYLVVPTDPDSPEPRPSLTWDTIANTFREIGAEHIVVSGQLFALTTITDSQCKVAFPKMKAVPLIEAEKMLKEYEKISGQSDAWREQNHIPVGCVGLAAIGFLQQGFKVSISDIVATEGKRVITYSF